MPKSLNLLRVVPYVPEERLERKPMNVSYGALPPTAN